VDPLLVAYLSYTTLLVVTPGSTTAVVVRNTLEGGRMAGLAAAAGAALGNTSHATAAGLGLAVIFAHWPMAMTGLRLAGAAYFAWLGLSSLYRARLPDGGLPMLSGTEMVVDPDGDRSGSFRQGFAANILNPAIVSFYVLGVPSFLPAGAPRWYFALLAAIHITLAFTCHGLWAVALARLRRIFRHAGACRALEAATGIALIVLSAKVLAR